MSKLLNTMFMVTQSVRPSTGMFASGGLIYYTSSLGRYNLANQAGDFVITEFVGSGTWTRQSDAKLIQVLLVGGGGGGGGGTKAGVGRATGGQGGCGGAMLISYIASASLVGTTFTVNVGGGGNGGLGSNSITGVGLAGASGGPTSLVSASSTLLLAPGGPAGISLVSGAVPPNVNAGLPSSNDQILSTYKTIFLYGLNGAGSSNALVRTPSSTRLFTITANYNPDGISFHALNGVRGVGAGGSGGDIIPGPPRTARAGSSGSGIWTGATAFESGTPGLGGTGVFGSNGVSNAYSTAYIFGISGSTTGFTYGLGTAGHGGGSGNITNPATLNGGNGGNGGYYGAGGGGGGGCSTGSAATAPSGGRGGDGGGGYACFIEYF